MADYVQSRARLLRQQLLWPPRPRERWHL